MNTFKKYCPNVFVANCTEKHEKGETIILETKYGKEIECEVFNYLGSTKEGTFLYSIQRLDGVNHRTRAEKKAERLTNASNNAVKKSNQYYEASKEGADFLALGEPIKVGHHSERRHRNLIERNWNRMEKSVEFADKAKEYERRSEYWAKRTNATNLSDLESIDYYADKLEEALHKHKLLKDKPELRAHSYSLTYAKKDVNELEKKYHTAIRLWGDEESVKALNELKEEESKKKMKKKNSFDDLIREYGGFFFFGSDMEAFKEKVNKLKADGYLLEGEKVSHIVAGLYVPHKHRNEIINRL